MNSVSVERGEASQAITTFEVRVFAGTQACLEALAVDIDAAQFTPFQHRAWLESWACSFPDAAVPDVFLVEVRDRTTGAVVLRLPLGFERRSGVRVLRGWDGGASDYNGPVLASDVCLPASMVRLLWPKIVAALPPCDVLALIRMPTRIGRRENPLLDLPGIVRSANSAHIVRLSARPAGALADGYDQSMRHSLDRKRRKLQNKGALVFRQRKAHEALDVLEALLSWRRDRFAEMNRKGDVERIETFWRRLASQTDIAYVADLALDGRLLAGGFGTRTGDGFHLLSIGFDPTWKNWSPGLVLVDEMLKLAQADELELFDFTVGEEGYKLKFGAEAEPLFDLYRARSLKGFLALMWLKLQRSKANTAKQRDTDESK